MAGAVNVPVMTAPICVGMSGNMIVGVTGVKASVGNAVEFAVSVGVDVGVGMT